MLFYTSVVIASVGLAVVAGLSARRWRKRSSLASALWLAAIVLAAAGLAEALVWGALLLEVLRPWEGGRIVSWSFRPSTRAVVISCIPLDAGLAAGLLCFLGTPAEKRQGPERRLT
jgi:hypothetical protein